MAYPTSTQEMVDRLLADRSFEVQQIVNDNFPAVREQFVLQLQADQPDRVNTPEKLVAELLWWDRNQGGRAVVDPVLDVPFRASTGSAVLVSAVEQLQDMAQLTAGSPYGASQGIAAFVGSLKGSTADADAVTNTAAADANEVATKNTQEQEDRARVIRILGVVAVIVALVALILYLRSR